MDATQTPNGAVAVAEMVALGMDEWQEYVAAHPLATAFHHRRWIETLIAQYGFTPFIPAVKSGGEIQSAVPFLAGRSLTGKIRLSSLPFTDCIQILSTDADAERQLTTLLRSCPRPYQSMSIRTDTGVDTDAVPSDWVRHELATDKHVEELSAKFAASLRRNLRAAERNGLTFSRHCDDAAMDVFYNLHVQTRRQKGIPVQPKSYFRRLLGGVLKEGLGYIGVITHDGRAIAAAVFLCFNDTVIYKYGASSADALSLRPNEWLMFEAIRLASEEGFSRFDFGVSAREQEGLRRFKKKWGAVESDVYTVPLVGAARRPHHASPAVKIVGGVIRDSPSFVCRILGEVFYRFAA